MAKCLYNTPNQSTINNGDNSSPSQVAPPPSTLTGNTPPSINQLTTTNTTLLPTALQAKLLSLIAQFLQHATPTASTSHEATQSTCELSAASTEHLLEQPLLSITADTNLSTVAVLPRLTVVTATTGHSAFIYQTSSLPA